MKNKFINIMTKILVIVAISGSIILATYIYSNAEDDEEKTNKIESEITYLDTKITSLINRINGVELQNYKISITKVEENKGNSSAGGTEQESSKKQETEEDDESKEETTISKMEEEQTVSDKNEADWSWIQGETEVLYSVWANIVLDLYDLGISSEKIVGFSNTMDQALIAIKNHDKTMSAAYIAKMYNFLVDFAKASEISDLKKNAIQTKNYVINAYAYIQDEHWDRVQTEINGAKNYFANVMNDIENHEKQRAHNINKIYILIEELKNSLATKDKEIFYIKYKNLLEEMNTLM